MTRAQILDDAARQAWREALPGVPDDQVILPRYHANGYNFPAARLHGSDSAEVWWFLRRMADGVVLGFGTVLQIGKGPDPFVRRQVKNTLCRAERWWDRLGEVDPLTLNQSLYTRRDKWKDIGDSPEFQICLALCWTWLTLPANRRSKAEAVRRTRELYRVAVKRFESGEIRKAEEPR